MEYYLWFLIGCLLLAAEMATGSFFLVFFGVAAIVVGICAFFGLESLVIQGLVFALVGIALVLGLRKKILAKRSHSKTHLDVGAQFIVDIDLNANSEGSVSYQGSPWTALNIGNAPIKKGDRVQIKETRGIRLLIEKINNP